MNHDDATKDLKFTKTHEWVRINGTTATVGISDHAQCLLGDIVFLSLPEVGSSVSKEQECAVVESVKSASDVFSPLSGKITSINSKLLDDPQAINSDAYGCWFFEIEFSNPEEIKDLLSSTAYSSSLKNSDH